MDLKTAKNLKQGQIVWHTYKKNDLKLSCISCGCTKLDQRENSSGLLCRGCEDGTRDNLDEQILRFKPRKCLTNSST